MNRKTFGYCVATAIIFLIIGHIYSAYQYHNDLKKARKKIYKIEAQHDACCKLIQSIDSDYVMDVLSETDEWQNYTDTHQEIFRINKYE